ncbi:MAG TPA: hypothetical protein VFB38_03860 [Chthonomonadaceae bacterium]|nr:hypothetical protein [Chthonomonadaceae bacterium]
MIRLDGLDGLLFALQPAREQKSWAKSPIFVMIKPKRIRCVRGAAKEMKGQGPNIERTARNKSRPPKETHKYIGA